LRYSQRQIEARVILWECERLVAGRLRKEGEKSGDVVEVAEGGCIAARRMRGNWKVK
jgi:hypothetical protein